MSQAPTGAPTLRARDPSDETTIIDGDDDVQTILDALDDADCRAILDETGKAALSAREVSTACDLPLSTTYRKLEMLTDANLLAERTRIRRSGKHASEYVRRVDDVVVSVSTSDGVQLRVSESERIERPPLGVAAGD